MHYSKTKWCEYISSAWWHKSNAVQIKVRNVAQHLGRKPSVILADSNCGIFKSLAWDVQWVADDFKNVVEFAMEVSDGDLTGVKLVWFVSDQQLSSATDVLVGHGLSYRLKTWVKKQKNKSGGRRFRNDCEFMILAWKGGNESSPDSPVPFVEHIEASDPDRQVFQVFLC